MSGSDAGPQHDQSAGLEAVSEAGLDPHLADVGPFYDAAGAKHQLGGISDEALRARRRRGTVLALPVKETWVYPAWQFSEQGTVQKPLARVLRALRGLEPWAAAVWLVSANPGLDGHSPRTLIRAAAQTAASEPIDDLCRQAQQDLQTLTS